MIQLVLEIVVRIFFGLCCIGFSLGVVLNEKYPFFDRVGLYTGFLILMYGFTRMFIYAILGC